MVPCTGLQAEYAVVAGGNESSSPPSEALATYEPPAGPTQASRVAAAAPAPVSAQQSSSEAGTLHDSFMQDALKLQKAHVKTNRKVCDIPWCIAITIGLKRCQSPVAPSTHPVSMSWLAKQALSC